MVARSNNWDLEETRDLPIYHQVYQWAEPFGSTRQEVERGSGSGTGIGDKQKKTQ